MNRLSPTGIEYGDYAWNFASGCDNNIDGKCKAGGFKCWAHSISQRFEDHYPNGFKPTLYPDSLCSPVHLKKPSRILCAFMGDLFWDCPEFNPDRNIEALMPSRKASIQMSLKGWIYTTIKQCPQHTFMFLTKQSVNLHKFNPFPPDNCWVGVTATDDMAYTYATHDLEKVEAKVKYISFEPLLTTIDCGKPWDKRLKLSCINWVIIGSCTGTKPEMEALIKRYPRLTLMPWGKRWTAQPNIDWVQEIVDACDKAKLPVFIKNNMFPLFKTELNYLNEHWLRQEMPV